MGPREKLTNAATTLRKLAARVAELEDQLKARNTLDEAEKIASEMKDKGILPPDQIKATAKKWVDEGQDLKVLQEAVKVAEKLPDLTWSGTQESHSGSGRPEDRVLSFLIKND